MTVTITAKAKYVSHPRLVSPRIRVTWTDTAGRKHTRHVGYSYGTRTRLPDAVALAMGVSPEAVVSTDVIDASDYELFAVDVPRKVAVHMTSTWSAPSGWTVVCRCGWETNGHTSQAIARAGGDVHLDRANGHGAPHMETH